MSTATTVLAAPATFSQPADFYQTRDFGQKWEATAQLLRQHGRAFFATLLRYSAPWLLLGVIIEAAGYATTNTGAYFGKTIVGGFITVFAFMLLILPGIYVAVALTLLPAVMFLEEEGGISRCFDLIKGHWWSTFGLALVYGLLYVGVLFLPAMLLGYFIAANPDGNHALLAVPFSLFTAVTLFFLHPIMNVLMAFNYFSIVEAKESRGLEWRAAQLGEAAPLLPATPDSFYAPDDERPL